MAGCIQNLKPWPKGVSGNPAGRPKNDISVEIARAVFENNPEAIYRGMARRLAKGDARVFKVLADRAYGKVKEQVEFGRRDDVRAMSDAELNTGIAELMESLGFRPYDQSDWPAFRMTSWKPWKQFSARVMQRARIASN